jgi:hypothetical protein
MPSILTISHGDHVFGPSDKAGSQYPKPDSQEFLQNMCNAIYGEKDLDMKTFPHLHPYGHGGWYHNCSMPFQAHIKMRLFDLRGIYAADPFFLSMITWLKFGCECIMRGRSLRFIT